MIDVILHMLGAAAIQVLGTWGPVLLFGVWDTLAALVVGVLNYAFWFLRECWQAAGRIERDRQPMTLANILRRHNWKEHLCVIPVVVAGILLSLAV